jgi:hypothetical protein
MAIWISRNNFYYTRRQTARLDIWDVLDEQKPRQLTVDGVEAQPQP